MIFDSLFWILGGWVIRICMIPVIGMRKDDPTTSLAWVAVIFLAPWFGLIMYLLVGEYGLSRPRLSRRLKSHQDFHRINSQYLECPNYLGCQVNDDYRVLVNLAERHGGLPLLGGNQVLLIANTDDFIEHLVLDISKACSHVHLLFYIFRNDETGKKVAQALVDARKRGVECRVLADAVGSRGMFSQLGRWMSSKGVEVYPALPANPLRLRLSRLDIRNHRKLAIIDGQTGYTGSQNIVNSDFGHKKAGEWHDVMVRIKGPSARQLQAVFVEDWYYETDQVLDFPDLYPGASRDGSAAIQVVPTGPDQPTEGFQDILIQSIQSARTRISIASPYFIPSEGLITALRLASARGVRVDIIVPDRSDHLLVDQASAYYCGVALRNGCNVYLFNEGMLHSKIMTVDDDMAMVGSANFDIRSFYLNIELVTFIFEPEFIYNLRMLQNCYKGHATAIRPEAWLRRPLPKRMVEGVVKIFSPLL
ncbi:cardiolipin synthase [Desulfonatronovibrio magnus]|uniref:cardiolipin synthase n=1 Tax=Desulfonatronovibrio magnus TaxID=698827 RepID=UPI0005EBC2B7|nr:cardiolipin synthase [Desulfonatronovibrio magnus]